MKAQILIGDVLDRLRELPDCSVQCCVTSPPYWGLRDYGVTGQLGLEATPLEYCEKMVAVFKEVKRVLLEDGVLWLNIGDSYAGGGNYRGVDSESSPSEKQRSNGGARGVSQLLGSAGRDSGCKPKDICGIPWMLAFALRADGWWLRQDIIWSKPNPMPESVQDRCTKAHEYLFMLTKSARYYFDSAAIAEPLAASSIDRLSQDVANQIGSARVPGKTNGNMKAVRFGGAKYGDDESKYSDTKSGNPWEPDDSTRNKRSVWEIATQPYSEAHFATFPEALVEPCILAGSKPGDTVLDPFCGSGTTGVVSLRYHRDFIGIELNPMYAQLAEKRIGQEAPMFNQIEVTA